MHRRGSTSPTAFCRCLIRREKRSWISANSFTTRLRDRSIKPTLIFRTSPAVDCPLRNTDKCKRKILWNSEKKVFDLEHPLYKFVRDFFKISILRSMLLSEHIPTPICHHLFYDNANRTATDSSSPFVVETTEEDKTPQVNGTPILASKGIKKIEVYGYATPAHIHSFTYSASGATITATCNGAGTCDITSGTTLTISAPTGDLTADGSKTFPATLSTGYNTTAFPGTYTIAYTKDGQPFDGTPTEAGDYTASVTVGTATASVSYTVTAPTYTVTWKNWDGTVLETDDTVIRLTMCSNVRSRRRR